MNIVITIEMNMHSKNNFNSNTHVVTYPNNPMQSTA